MHLHKLAGDLLSFHEVCSWRNLPVQSIIVKAEKTASYADAFVEHTAVNI